MPFGEGVLGSDTDAGRALAEMELLARRKVVLVRVTGGAGHVIDADVQLLRDSLYSRLGVRGVRDGLPVIDDRELFALRDDSLDVRGQADAVTIEPGRLRDSADVVGRLDAVDEVRRRPARL